jgi:hypothetical protein
VGTALPSFAHWLFAIACYVVTGVQLVGFIGVSRVRTSVKVLVTMTFTKVIPRPQENLKFYRLYQRINTLAVLVAFGMAAAFIGVSAGRHNTAITNCKNAYFRVDSTVPESQTLCNIFTWVVVGLMAFLWAVLAIFQVRQAQPPCSSDSTDVVTLPPPLVLSPPYDSILWIISTGGSQEVFQSL